ncbi:MAG: methyltransferase, partial [Spongiibacteraceae bacterium]
PSLGARLDDQNYSVLREIELSEKTFDETRRVWTKPGVYGWQKIDAGSALLAQCLTQVWPQAPASVLDLGCGYGYLSLRIAQQWTDATLTATDNNVAAVHACKKNLATFSDRAEVVLDDCAVAIEKKFDAVICNPPFHQGFSVEGDLTTRFLQSARAHLHKNGRALFVVNQFIPLERKAQPLFSRVSEVSRTEGFKVLVLEA